VMLFQTGLEACTPCLACNHSLRDRLLDHLLSSLTNSSSTETELRSLPPMAGAGANGSYFEHLMLHDKIADGAHALARALSQLLTGESPVQVVQWFRSGRSHPTLKGDSDVDTRPLTCPTSAWRCTTKAWAQMFKEEVIQATGCTQYGCGQPGGATLLRQALETALLADPTKAFLSIDIKNMHGSLTVENLETQVTANAPRMWPLLAPWIRCQRSHVYKDDTGALHDVPAVNPLDQGCPSSGMLACIAAIPLHTAMKTHGRTFGFQDDTYVLVDPPKAKDCLVHASISVAAIGCQINFTKSTAWATAALDLDGTGVAQVSEVPLALKQPLSILLGTLTHDYEVTASRSAQKLVAARQVLYNKLLELRRYGLTLQHAYCLFRAATAGDLTYAQSCHLYPGEFFEALDVAALTAINALLNVSREEHDMLGVAKDRWFLPFRDGGMGLHSAMLSGPTVFLSSWIRSLPVIAKIHDYTSASEMLSCVGPLKVVLVKAEQRLSHLGVTVGMSLDESIEEQSKTLNKRWKTEAYSRIVNSISSGARGQDFIALEESSGTGAGAWLQFPSRPEHCFTDAEYVTSIRLRMSLPVFQHAPGVSLSCNHFGREVGICGSTNDEYGIHALCCKRGGHVNQRHNAIRDSTASSLREAGITHVLVEQTAPDGTAALRPDVCYHDAKGRATHLDIEVTTRHVHRNGVDMRRGALIEQAEGVKRRKYAHLRLMPCVFSHLGRIGRGMQVVVKSVFTEPDLAARSEYIAQFYQSVSCSLQKGNVSILAAAGSLIGPT
jgi:hypothetical protein